MKAPHGMVRTPMAVTEASTTRDLFPRFLMEASLLQDGQTKATATAKFIVPKEL